MTGPRGRAARRRAVVTLVAFAALTSVVAGPAIAASNIPLHSLTLTGGKSPFYDLDLPIVGGAHYLVFSDQPYPYATETLRLRTSAGTTSTLAFDSSTEEEPTSLAGSSLTGADDFESTPGVTQNNVEWWNLATGTSGILDLPLSDTYLGSAPDGILAIGPNGGLQDHPSTGQPATKLGTPFPSAAAGTVPVALAADGGIVLSEAGVFVSMSWKHPGTFTGLDVKAAGDTDAFCSSLAAGNAGCGATDSTGHPLIIRAPVSGGPPVVTRLAKSACPDQVVTTASVTAWGDGCLGTINSVPATTGSPVTSSNAFIEEGAGFASAYGQLIATVSPGGRFALDQVASAGATRHRIVTPRRSAVVAADIALSPGRVAYDDDQTAAVTTWTRVVGGTPTAVTAGAATLLGHPGVGANIDVGGGAHLSISGANTAAAGMVHSLTIHSPIRTATLATKSVAEDVEISGNRVVFDTGAGPKSMLYDLRTGVLTTITGAVSASVWGNYLAFAKADGSVWREQLGGHHPPVELRGPLPAKQRLSFFVQVFSFGDFVAWQLEAAIAAPPFQVAHDGYRNARTMAAAHLIPDTYFPRAATSDGLLEQHYAGNQVTYYLQHYGSTQRVQVLSTPQTGLLAGSPNQVAIDGDRIAWIDGTNHARIAPLPVAASPDPPRYLGDAQAPTTAKASGLATTPWRAFIPLSAALTSCTVTIYAGSAAVRTLTCAKADALLGDAAVGWDGKDSGGHALGAGAYRWQLSAVNTDGAALAADGSAGAIQGRIVLR